MNINQLSPNSKRIDSCRKRGGGDKKRGHEKEVYFNNKYNPDCKNLTMKAESDCVIHEKHPILDILYEKGIIQNKNQRNTSNKSGGSIQLTLGNIPELSGEGNLEYLKDKLNFKNLLLKYMKKSESERPADLLVYDTEQSRLFFNMDEIIEYIVYNCELRKLSTGRIKGDFKDETSFTKKRSLFTYEYRSKHKSYFLGFNGGMGKYFINLMKNQIKYYEDPY
tara:strand:+ start:233 stop:898 length:666 start_codon:yes stop_codon:yes gene_type:complete